MTPYGGLDRGQHWLRLCSVAITQTYVDLPSVGASDNRVGQISLEIHRSLITETSLEITYLKFHSNLPGANELMYYPRDNPWTNIRKKITSK